MVSVDLKWRHLKAHSLHASCQCIQYTVPLINGLIVSRSTKVYQVENLFYLLAHSSSLSLSLALIHSFRKLFTFAQQIKSNVHNSRTEAHYQTGKSEAKKNAHSHTAQKAVNVKNRISISDRRIAISNR